MTGRVGTCQGSLCAAKGAVPQRVRIPPGNCRVWTPPDCQAFLSRLFLHVRALEVICDKGAARQSLALAPVERGPAFRLARPQGLPARSAVATVSEDFFDVLGLPAARGVVRVSSPGCRAAMPGP